jgi:phage-related protein
MQTFSYVPDFGAQNDIAPTVVNSKFGDGYEQRYAFGLNTQAQKRTLAFANRSQADADGIDNFLRARNAVEAFLWTPPNESVALIWVCRAWSRITVVNNNYTVNAVFEQVFEPS